MTPVKQASSLFCTQRAFAEAIGVSRVSVVMWLNGTRLPSALKAIKIEKVTNGAVTRQQIRPDIFGDI